MSSEAISTDEWKSFQIWIREVQNSSQQMESYSLASGSLLSKDEQGMPEHCSVAAVTRSLLDCAVDDLACAFAIVDDLERVHPVGIPTLVRGAIELAGIGMWVLTGDGRQGRQERALQVAHDSLRNASRFADQLAGTPSVPNHVLDDARMARDDFNSERGDLLDGAAKLGINKEDAKKRLNRTQALQEVDDALGTEFLLRWQMCSGYAHGYSWAPRLFNTIQYKHTMEGGGKLMGGILSLDTVFALLGHGQRAIVELQGSFEAGRRSITQTRPEASIKSSRQVPDKIQILSLVPVSEPPI